MLATAQIERSSCCSLSYLPYHATANASTFVEMTPAICHHSLMLLEMLPSSPPMTSEKTLYATAEIMRLERTRVGKRQAADSCFGGSSAGGDFGVRDVMTVGGTEPVPDLLRGGISKPELH